MTCYIYKIINQITNEKYVGQTTNFSRRKKNHLAALNSNRHPNPKLQNAWNKYGEKNFHWEVKKYSASQEELDQLEIDAIKEENSLEKGYNLNPGGRGGNGHLRRQLSFEQFCFAYAGNRVFDGMTAKTGTWLGCDSSTISAIKREKSYDDFREAFLLLPESQQDQYLRDFIKVFNLDSKAPPKRMPRLTDEQVVDFLCLISRYGKGAEIAFLREVNHGKGLGHVLKTNKNYFRESKNTYNLLSDDEIFSRAEEVYYKYHISENLTYKLRDNKTVRRIDCAL